LGLLDPNRFDITFCRTGTLGHSEYSRDARAAIGYSNDLRLIRAPTPPFIGEERIETAMPDNICAQSLSDRSNDQRPQN
jgi:hypothetical protein